MMSLFCLISLMVTCSAYPQVMRAHSDLSLAKYMMHQANRQALITDPATSGKCFALHLPLLEKIANQWSTDHNRCLSTANSQRDEVVAAMKAKYDALSAAATGVCQYVSTCQSIEEGMDFFNCFSKLGTNSLSTIYTISNNATDDATSLSEQLEHVDAEMYKCTNISERTYVKDTANAYDALDKCLQNGSAVDIDTTTTTTVQTTFVTEEEATAEPPTTLEDISTAAEILTNSTTELSTVSTNFNSEPLPEEDMR